MWVVVEMYGNVFSQPTTNKVDDGSLNEPIKCRVAIDDALGTTQGFATC